MNVNPPRSNDAKTPKSPKAKILGIISGGCIEVTPVATRYPLLPIEEEIMRTTNPKKERSDENDVQIIRRKITTNMVRGFF